MRRQARRITQLRERDVVVSDWRRGPDVLVSGKSMFSTTCNRNNRYEEAIGEATNLRDHYPLAGWATPTSFATTSSKEARSSSSATYWSACDALMGPFDATVLLVADWDDEGPTLNAVEDLPPPSRFRGSSRTCSTP